MDQEWGKPQAKLSGKPSEEYRNMLTPHDEPLIAEILQAHPNLTRDEILEMPECAGY